MSEKKHDRCEICNYLKTYQFREFHWYTNPTKWGESKVSKKICDECMSLFERFVRKELTNKEYENLPK